jgi:hypothetical protein
MHVQYWYQPISHCQPFLESSLQHQGVLWCSSRGRRPTSEHRSMEYQSAKFTKRTVSTAKQQRPELVASYRKRAFGYLNIFRAKTKNKIPTSSSSATTSKRYPRGYSLTRSLTHKHTHSHHSHQHRSDSKSAQLRTSINQQWPVAAWRLLRLRTTKHTRKVDPTAQSDPSPIRQPSHLRHARCSLRCPSLALLK